MKLAVAVPTRNRAALLARCLESLSALRQRPDVVVVVDDGSTDATPDILADAVARGVVDQMLQSRRAGGPAAARNRAWRAVDADLVAFTDDDCVVDPGWLTALASALQAAPADVAGVGGRVLSDGDGLVSRYMTLHRILEPPRSLGYLVTANCAFRRSALESVGGFDESVRAPGGEDPGLCMALRATGARFIFQPQAVVTHHFRESLPDFLKTFYRYGRGCRIVMDR